MLRGGDIKLYRKRDIIMENKTLTTTFRAKQLKEFSYIPKKQHI